MPFSFSFDLESAHTDDHCRISLAFNRFGWEAVGGSHWRYPAFDSNGPEDYFGQVAPALAYFDDLVSAHEIKVTKYLLEAHAQICYAERSGVGHPIVPAAELQILECVGQAESRAAKLSAKTLRRYCAASEQFLA